jgi:hypothetical protein
LFEAAWEVKKEGRMYFLQQDNNNIVKKVIMPAAGFQGTADQLLSAFALLVSEDDDEHVFESWEHYKTLRSQLHIISRCEFWPGD